jgi:NDP-sugar pyrophosphorylase family protein
MVIQLLQQKNNNEKNIISIILCAGKGTRIANKYSSIPKTLIKVKSFDDKPILEILLDRLNKIANINQNWIVIGYLGKKINSYVNRLISYGKITKNKIRVVDAIEDYEKGPLYSLLSVLSSKWINSNQSYLIIPGDTVFEIEILLEASKIIQNHNSKRPLIFYQVLNDMEFKNKMKSAKTVRIIETSTKYENSNTIEILNKFYEKIKISDLNIRTFKQVMPIFALDYDFLLLLANVVPKLNVNTIYEALNAIKKDYQIQACKIETNGKFFDIDTEIDLKNLNKKKSGQ